MIKMNFAEEFSAVKGFFLNFTELIFAFQENKLDFVELFFAVLKFLRIRVKIAKYLPLKEYFRRTLMVSAPSKKSLSVIFHNIN